MTPEEKAIKLSEEDEELLRVLYVGNNLSELDINVILSYIENVKKQTAKEIFLKELLKIYEACNDSRVWEIQIMIGDLAKKLNKEGGIKW